MSLLPKSRVKMRGIITTLSIANWTKAITGIKVIETWGIRDRFCFRWLLVNEPVKGFSCPMSPYKVIRLRNPGNSCFWNQKSWNFKSVIQLKESRSPLAIGIWNPSFTDKESACNSLLGIRNPQFGIQNPWLSCVSLQGAILNSSERNLRLLTRKWWRKPAVFTREKNGTQVNYVIKLPRRGVWVPLQSLYCRAL